MAPPPPETPFCAGRVNWETPSIWLSSECLVEGHLTEAYLEKVAGLSPGQSLRIEADVPSVEIQRALKQLKPGTHLMLNYAYDLADDTDDNYDDEDHEKRCKHYMDIVRYYILSGVTIHINPNVDPAYVQVLSNLHDVNVTLAFRGQVPDYVIETFARISFNFTYSILPEHSLETAKAIALAAAFNGSAICFDEGTSGEIIYVLLTQKKTPQDCFTYLICLEYGKHDR